MSDTSSVVERLMGEQPIGLAQAARKFGAYRSGKPVHPSTLGRWATAGTTLPDGRRVKLEVIHLNGRMLTSWPAVCRYIEAQQPVGDVGGEQVRSPSARQRAAEKAGEALAAMGC